MGGNDMLGISQHFKPEPVVFLTKSVANGNHVL